MLTIGFFELVLAIALGIIIGLAGITALMFYLMLNGKAMMWMTKKYIAAMNKAFKEMDKLDI